MNYCVLINKLLEIMGELKCLLWKEFCDRIIYSYSSFCLFVIHVWHARFPLKRIKKYLR